MIQRTYLSRSKATKRLEHTPRAVERERSIQDEAMIFRMIFRRKCMKIIELQGHEFGSMARRNCVGNPAALACLIRLQARSSAAFDTEAVGSSANPEEEIQKESTGNR